MPTTVNPATGAPLAHYDETSDAALDAALDRADAAFATWRSTPLAVRADALLRLASLLERDVEAHARRMTEEMGKPIAQARAEALKCALVCRTAAAHGAEWLADSLRPTEAARSLVAWQPLGPVLAVMPWNFPYWQVLRFAAPAVMAGNAVVLKHASNVLGCGEAIAALFRDAGVPDGLVQHVVLPSSRVAGVVADRRVRGVTLTGSEAAGRAVGAAAGQALKPSVLELGGTDPFVVLADADVTRAAAVGAQARAQNNGQSCIAAKRFIVEASVADAFTALFTEAMAALTVGDPIRDGTDVGPLVHTAARDELHHQVSRAVAEGALLALGGTVPDGPGAYYPPTVLTDVAEGSVAYREELFGPVAAVTVARDAGHALALANAGRYGLGASVWTADRARGERFARDVRAGAVFVNAMTRSHPLLPFGGVDASGWGRELGPEGMRAFTFAQTLWVD